MPVQPRSISPNPSATSTSDLHLIQPVGTSTATLPAGNPLHTNDPSDPTTTLTPSASPQPNQAPGTVPIQNVSDAQETLNQFIRLIDRNSSLKLAIWQ